MTPVVHTIGHGARSIDDFLAVLASESIAALVDVRAFPVSRRHPHFTRAKLEPTLRDVGVEYRWEGSTLGGRRTADEGSAHVAFRDDAFRGYADHMATATFRAGLDHVLVIALERRVAVMCAESDPYHCHRRLISDALAVRRVDVVHLLTPTRRERHTMHPELRVTNGRLIYDGGLGRQGLLF